MLRKQAPKNSKLKFKVLVMEENFFSKLSESLCIPYCLFFCLSHRFKRKNHPRSKPKKRISLQRKKSKHQKKEQMTVQVVEYFRGFIIHNPVDCIVISTMSITIISDSFKTKMSAIHVCIIFLF